MTDNEIIKALECCNHNHVWQKECFDCEYATFEGQCGNELIKDALDLINRQKEEIEGLKKQNSISQHLLSEAWHSIEEKDKFCENAKSEAIREFAERLKEKYGIADVIVTVDNKDVDNLVKEMTEGGNGDNS